MDRCNDLKKLRRTAPLAIVVMGVSGCGKSTLGAKLADKIDCRFLDGDLFHSPESITKMHAGNALSDNDRWPWLDRVGNAVDADVRRDGLAVVACSALKRAYRDRLNEVVTAPLFFVFLDASSDELRRRLTSRSDHYMPASLLSSQLLTLERPQQDELALTIDAGQPLSTLCDLAIGGILANADRIGRSRDRTSSANPPAR